MCNWLRAKFAIDKNTNTSWTTEGYKSRIMTSARGPKTGVGLYVQLKQSALVNTLRITNDTGGWLGQVYVSSREGAELSDWGPVVGSIRNAQTGTFDLALTPREGSYVLLWITDLGGEVKPQTGETRIRASIAEVSPRG